MARLLLSKDEGAKESRATGNPPLATVNTHLITSLHQDTGGSPMPSLAQKWLEQGIHQGIQQGIQKGIQQGIQEGMIRDAQEMVLEAIDAKFGACPEEIRKRIMAIEDRTRLF